MQLGFERIFQAEEARGLPKGIVWAKQTGCTHGDSRHAGRGLAGWWGARETALGRPQATSPRQLDPAPGWTPLPTVVPEHGLLRARGLLVRGKAKPMAGSLFPNGPALFGAESPRGGELPWTKGLGLTAQPWVLLLTRQPGPRGGWKAGAPLGSHRKNGSFPSSWSLFIKVGNLRNTRSITTQHTFPVSKH